MSAQKALQGSKTEIWELLGAMKENTLLPDEVCEGLATNSGQQEKNENSGQTWCWPLKFSRTVSELALGSESAVTKLHEVLAKGALVVGLP